MTKSNITLRVSDELKAAIKIQAANTGMSMYQYIIDTLTLRVASQKEAEAYLRERAARSKGTKHVMAILDKAGKGNRPMPGDELPEGWTDADKQALMNSGKQ